MSSAGGEVRFGYTLMTEKSGPRELVGYEIGDESQQEFLQIARSQLLPALREASA